MKMRIRPLLHSCAALLLALPASLAAQKITLEEIFLSGDFRAESFSPVWSPDGESFTLVETDSLRTGSDIWEQGIRTGKRDRVIEGGRLVVPGATAPLQVEEVIWHANRQRALLYTNSQQVWRQRTKGTYYVYDLQGSRLVPLSTAEGWQQFAKFSPDGTRIGFVRNNDLFVHDLRTGVETRLTHDGSDVIINGTFDWVYEEELGLTDGWRWSPDGRKIAYWRLDQSPVKVFNWVNDLTGQYSTPIGLRYPKAGEAPSLAKIGVLDLATGATRWMETGGAPDDYLARMDWAASSDEVVIQRLNRLQNRIDVLLADAQSGKSRVIFADTDSAWVDVDDDLTFLGEGRQLLWTSEREGFNQLYLYDRGGRVVRKLTPDSWDVLAVEGVDEGDGWIYFSGTGGSPMERHLFRVRMDGSGLRKLTEGPGTHSASVGPDGHYFVDTYSRNGVPPVSRLHAGDGTVLRTLAENADVAAELREAGVRATEFFRFTTDGGTELNGWMIRPPDFVDGRRYPVLLYVYGTPGAQTVTDAWGGNRYLWHQHLAAKGYIVASVDTRGTGGRGRAFEKAGYLRQGEVVTDDLMSAARYLGSLPYVDPARIGMWGWSGGGYTTGLSLARGGDLFRAGLSVAPVTDWRLYDNIYTERFMRTPQENPEGYDRTSVVKLAPGMTARYLLIHGTADDNVHFQNSVQLSDALQRAGKQFEFMLYPNKNHSISGARTQLHLFTMMTNWLEDNL